MATQESTYVESTSVGGVLKELEGDEQYGGVVNMGTRENPVLGIRIAHFADATPVEVWFCRNRGGMNIMLDGRDDVCSRDGIDLGASWEIASLDRISEGIAMIRPALTTEATPARTIACLMSALSQVAAARCLGKKVVVVCGGDAMATALSDPLTVALESRNRQVLMMAAEILANTKIRYVIETGCILSKEHAIAQLAAARATGIPLLAIRSVARDGPGYYQSIPVVRYTPPGLYRTIDWVRTSAAVTCPLEGAIADMSVAISARRWLDYVDNGLIQLESALPLIALGAFSEAAAICRARHDTIGATPRGVVSLLHAIFSDSADIAHLHEHSSWGIDDLLEDGAHRTWIIRSIVDNAASHFTRADNAADHKARESNTVAIDWAVLGFPIPVYDNCLDDPVNDPGPDAEEGARGDYVDGDRAGIMLAIQDIIIAEAEEHHEDGDYPGQGLVVALAREGINFDFLRGGEHDNTGHTQVFLNTRNHHLAGNRNWHYLGQVDADAEPESDAEAILTAKQVIGALLVHLSQVSVNAIRGANRPVAGYMTGGSLKAFVDLLQQGHVVLDYTARVVVIGQEMVPGLATLGFDQVCTGPDRSDYTPENAASIIRNEAWPNQVANLQIHRAEL